MTDSTGDRTEELIDLMAALDQLAGGAAPGGPESDPDPTRTFSWMERLAAEPGGLELLVGRYGTSRRAVLLRPLTRLLTRTLARQGTGPILGSLLLLLVEELACEDDAVRLQLLDGLRLLGARNAVPAPEHPPASLHRFVGECLGRGGKVQMAAVLTLTSLLESEVRFPMEQLAALRQALNSLPSPVSQEDAGVQAALQALTRKQAQARA
ncbi:MAG TPA: hypothetical protein VH877_27085 [Polyangia bacterium]|nr:hypothetical protein [Polyangia bacterium]